jgi:hypothetical protein
MPYDFPRLGAARWREARSPRSQRRSTVLAVWEPISESDPAPTPRLLGNLSDKRVHQL